MQWSGEPALYTKVHFGKYRGRRFDEIAASDPDYLRWIIEKSELETGISTVPAIGWQLQVSPTTASHRHA